MIVSYKFRIKDASSKRHLAKLAVAANQVWNFCVATQKEAERRWRGGVKIKWPTHFDLTYLTFGCNKELGIMTGTVGEVCRQFVQSRNTNKSCPNFRASFGGKAALGWVPFRSNSFQLKQSGIRYNRRIYRFWKSREIPADIKTGAFVCDARGRWFITFQCEVPEDGNCGNGKIGIDLGLKSIVATSDGEAIEAPQIFRRYEANLALAQRSKNKRQVRAIHAKIVASRKDFLHKLSTRLVRENSFIALGNVSASQLGKTKMAKSIYDAGWGELGTLLAYKARRHQAVFVKVDERFTTQTCSSCGSMPTERPKGIAGLGMREWSCSDCGVTHNRDTNAAMNILRLGLERQALVEGMAA